MDYFDAEWWTVIVSAIALVGHLAIGMLVIARQQRRRTGRRIS